MENSHSPDQLCAPWNAIEAVFNLRLDEIEYILDVVADEDTDTHALTERFDELVTTKWVLYDALFPGSACSPRRMPGTLGQRP